jgi:serine/alanine adding enzyme
VTAQDVLPTFEVLSLERDGADETAWDAFVAQPPGEGVGEGSTFCHRAAWRRVLADAMGAESHDFVARDSTGMIRGILPLARVRSPLFGDYLISLPFLNAGGPLGDPIACGRLAGAAVAEARRLGVDLLELRTRGVGIGTPPPLAVVARKITVRLPLPQSAAELWESFPAKLRSQVRRSQKDGLQTRFGSGEWEAFYEVFARHMRDLGTPVVPRRFFELVAERLGDIAVFGVVYRGAEPVAAGCGFRWRGEVEITWASALRAHQRSAPNMLLYWAFMERAIADGVRVFDFGRCTPGGGTHRFKQQWGGADVPLPWAQWSPRGRGLRTTPSPERPVYRAAAAMWRRLPLAVANRVGPLLARRLP